MLTNIISAFNILVGIYLLGRNNLVTIDGQVIWRAHPHIVPNVILPFMIIVAGGFLLLRRPWTLILALTVLAADALGRVMVGVEHYIGYMKYKDIPIPEPAPGTVIVVTNLWPSHILGIVEIFFVFVLLQVYFGKKRATFGIDEPHP